MHLLRNRRADIRHATRLATGLLGAWLAHAMFDMPIVQFSTHVRSGTGQWIAEAVATAGLLLVIETALVGFTVSTVMERVTGVPVFPTASTRRTLSECGPSASDANDLGDTHDAHAPAPSTWHS